MSRKSEITKKFKEKIKELKKHNNFYYNEDQPVISDEQYDNLKRDIGLLEKNNAFLKKLKLTENLVGSPPKNKFKKIKHLSPMLSLSNAFNKDNMNDFLKKINNFLNLSQNNFELLSEPKIDGISATLIYEKGELKKVYLEVTDPLGKIF